MTPAQFVLTLSTAVWVAACGGGDAPSDAGASTPGASQSACTVAGDCSEGLTCDDGLCRAQHQARLSVADPLARSCEVIVLEEGTEVFGAEMGDGVRGTHVREAPRTAIAFYRDADAPFPSTPVLVNHSGGGSLGLRRARCFDREGHPLTGDALRLEQ